MKIKRTALVLLLITGLCNKEYAQENKPYIDSINLYIKYVDSMIVECSINPQLEPKITKNADRFSNAQNDSSWCGEAVLYKSNQENGLYRLSYAGNCDSAFKLQDYYFNQNKIVFIRTVKALDFSENVDQYYFNDTLINSSAGKLYLTEGYAMLKKLSH